MSTLNRAIKSERFVIGDKKVIQCVQQNLGQFKHLYITCFFI